VCGVDRNQGMLAVARAEAPAIDWRLGRAEELPFEAGAFDAVLCQFGLMFFDDGVRALAEMWRVLRPGGRLAVAVWGPLADSPGYAAMADLLEQLFGARIASELRAPYRMGDPAALRSLFASAGIADVRIETLAGTARFPSITDWVRTDVKGWTLADKIDDADYELLLADARQRLRRFAREDGAVEFASPPTSPARPDDRMA
jgi:SAM-dependent methyltransferase